MGASKILNGDGTVTLTVTWPNVPVEKAQNVINAASNRLWLEGWGDHGTEEEPREFSDLSNQERLDILYQYATRGILSYARAQHEMESVGVARETAQAEAETLYSLSEA